MDNNEAKELRMTVVLRGSDELISLDTRSTLADTVEKLGHKLGANVVDVAFPKCWEDSPLLHETPADWFVE
ncbi:MAG: hypothetical protein HYX78_09780 [Armatimonadetes bacterium]|nr:hypothetical protein [Armatimonadota bacterium]